MRGIGLLISALAFAGIAASPASACRLMIPSAKFKNSDVVVNGTAYCLKRSGTCELKIDSVAKGNPDFEGRVVQIRVSDEQRIKVEGDTIIIGPCSQTFEPWRKVTSARFYLKIEKNGDLFAAYQPDVPDYDPSDREF